ncbi:Hypothetical protein I595_1151 [Croceitalea dokdonensis DOKDO 023]|uniref:BspA family leucine-rich repeat surface protein n=1 Tax=Croceitalea dokdonensis DOKDO 023 TaxID=1300341 RepID=A0A0P7AX50_9FLAO|nr:BspA family leucine-rich repeat surface protein [Croceitalea dokdonensis]KPM32723.1 Hypothetical protein I595_1151 [Croceitalea dokdonensis DOKDO 023]
MAKQLLIFCAVFCYFTSNAQDFVSRWNTGNTSGSSSGPNQITIPTNPAFTTYNYTVDWGDGFQDTGVTGDITHTYAVPGIYTIAIRGDFPAIFFNDSGDNLKILEIVDWGSLQWQSMENAFFGCLNLNFDAIAPPDLTQVTSLKNMFRGCQIFTGIVNNWDVSTITDMSGTFMDCENFNRPLDNWNTANVTDMSETFSGCVNFNEPLDNWNTASVTTMQDMFYVCVNFNQNINNWDVSQVTDMSGMFTACRNFNQPLNLWNVSNVVDMNLMFFRTNDFEQDLSTWQVGNVTNMNRMFDECAFNSPIGNWDVSSVTDMGGMFSDTPNFNQPLNNWDVSNVLSMREMFEGAQAFDQPLNNWDVANVTTMAGMFSGGFSTNSVFNQALNVWDVGSVTDMEGMFENNLVFNQPLDGWNTANVTNMSAMFFNADAFNQPLETWNVENVREFNQMFQNNDAFNQPLNTWNTGSATTLSAMFAGATTFNQPLDSWNTTLVTNMSSVFLNATAFDQDISSWNMENVSILTNMLSNSGLSQTNYDTLLVAWAGQDVRDNLSLGAANLTYCDGLSARQSLMEDHNWNFIGDSVNCSFVLCTEITMPAAGDTQVPANSDIRWAPTPNATGYRVTITRDDGSGPVVAYDQTLPATSVGVDFTNEFNAGDEVSVLVIPFNDEGDAVGCTPITFTVVDSWANSPDAFKITIDTRNLDNNSTNANQYRIDVNDGFPDYLTYDFSIDWGDGQYNNNVTNGITHTYLNPGIYTIAIIGDFPSFYHTSSNRDNLKLISMDQWGTQVWQSMKNTFYFCENMVYNASDVPNLSQVTSMQSMFRRTYLFNANINNWDVGNVTDLGNIFYQASIFNSPLDNWDVGNVTNMRRVFSSAPAFDQDLSSWNVGSVVNMDYMFEGASSFNQPLNSWNVANVTSMIAMFQRAVVFDQPLNNWNVSNVTTMESMFASTDAFNQNIDNWTVSNVMDMSDMFNSANAFDQPLNSWDVSSVTTMSSMFSNTNNFNQPLNNWDVGNVTTMSYMFSGAGSFNQNINSWNVTNVTDMTYMFSYATSFNQPLNSWDVNSVVSMRGTFRGARAFNQPLNSWDVSAVANMSDMFEDAVVFNQPLDNWDVSSVTLMESMFEDAETFDQNINDWNVSVVTNFQGMFKNAIAFNSPLNNWNTGEALNTAEMFRGASRFNQNIDAWNVSFVTNMQEMFKEASNFNQSLNPWNVASVTNMMGMFESAAAFNGNINDWNVRRVTNMQNMFYRATSFNQSINDWRTSMVQNMANMFWEASAYDQPMDRWLLGNVNMNSMFRNATAFNQALGHWDISGVTDMTDMLDNTALSRDHYDSTLMAWSELTPNLGIDLGAEGLPYCDALEERQSMIANFGWTFSQDVLDCPIPECTALTSPLDDATDVPVNTNINWQPTQFAREYQLTITIQPGNTVINETVTGTSYEFMDGTLSLGDTVEVLIVPVNDEGSASGCSAETFTISSDPPTVPECTQLTIPLANATDVSIGTNLTWDPIANADGYMVRVGTSTGATDIVNDENVGNLTNYAFANDLPENTVVFVTITPYNEEGNATGCNEEQFTTELIPVPPACTTLNNPLSGATNVPIDTEISWDAVDGATGYLVVVGDTQGGIEIANNVDVGNLTSYTFNENLREDRTHYVTIIPYNDVGDALGCAEQSFRTGTTTLSDPPECSTLSGPQPMDTDVAVDLAQITWNSVANADGYRITINGSTSDVNDVTDLLVNGTSHPFTNNFDNGETVTVNVVPFNTNGDAIGCSAQSFSIVAVTQNPPDCTSLSQPANGATNIAVSTDLSWGTITDSDGYFITVGTTTGGNDILDNLDVGNNTVYDLPADLPENTEIFVTIVPYNGAGNAAGCTEQSFTTESVATLPICTNLIAPLDGTTDVSVFTDLSWNAVANADGYRLTVGTTTGGNDILDNFDAGNSTVYNLPTDLPGNTEIFVTVAPYNNVGNATSCAEESFTTAVGTALPSCTSLNAPMNAAVDVSADVAEISWNPSPNADGYRISVNGNTSDANDVTNMVVTGTSHPFTNSFDNGETVTITIIPFNADGDAVGCTSESFTIESEAIELPDCTNLITPLNLDIDVTVDVTLAWNAADGAEGYRLTVGTATGLGNILDNEDVGNSTSYNLPDDLPENTEIFVSVTPYNQAGDAEFCEEESFITVPATANVPSCTEITSPANDSSNVSINSTISWNAIGDIDGYFISIGTTAGATDIVDNVDVGLSTSFEPVDNLPYGQEIFVNLIPYNEEGMATGCEVHSFLTEEETQQEVESLYGLSPDGDGINEFWVIEGIENYPANTVTIFNRWGDMVFKIDGYDNNGNVFRGEANQMTGFGASQLPEGTYFFQLQLPEGHNLQRTKGYLVLKR